MLQLQLIPVALFTRMCLIHHLFYTISKLIVDNRCECALCLLYEDRICAGLVFFSDLMSSIFSYWCLFLTAGVLVDMEGMILLACIQL